MPDLTSASVRRFCIWLLLIGIASTSFAQTNTTQLNDQARIRQDLVGCWTNLNRLEDGSMLTNTILLRDDGLWAFVSRETVNDGAYGGSWLVRDNSLVLVKRKKISKESLELRTYTYRLASASQDIFTIAHTNKLQAREIKAWHRSLNATQAISHYYELKEHEINFRSIR